MDDPEKIKGISQYKRVYCNEMSAFEHNDHKHEIKSFEVGFTNESDETKN
jgi:hypothetical protein